MTEGAKRVPSDTKLRATAQVFQPSSGMNLQVGRPYTQSLEAPQSISNTQDEPLVVYSTYATNAITGFVDEVAIPESAFGGYGIPSVRVGYDGVWGYGCTDWGYQFVWVEEGGG
jgi:hypothetical protein